MGNNKKLVFFVFFVACLNTLILADEKKYAIGVTAGYLSNFEGGFWPHVELNFQHKLSPRFTLQMAIDYYYKSKLDYHKYWKKSFLIPAISGIYRLNPGSSNFENMITYVSFGLGVMAITSEEDAPVVLGMYKIGGGLRYRLFKESFIYTDLLLHIPWFYLVPNLERVFISINIGYSLQL